MVVSMSAFIVSAASSMALLVGGGATIGDAIDRSSEVATIELPDHNAPANTDPAAADREADIATLPGSSEPTPSLPDVGVAPVPMDDVLDEVRPDLPDDTRLPYAPVVESVRVGTEIWERSEQDCGGPYVLRPVAEISHNYPVRVTAELRNLDETVVLRSVPMTLGSDGRYRAEIGNFDNPEIAAAEGPVDLYLVTDVEVIESPNDGYERLTPVTVHPARSCDIVH